MALRQSKASKWAAEYKKQMDERPEAQNRAKLNSQQEIDAIADRIIRSEQTSPTRSAWSAYRHSNQRRRAS